jgi:hypothetical protein
MQEHARTHAPTHQFHTFLESLSSGTLKVKRCKTYQYICLDFWASIVSVHDASASVHWPPEDLKSNKNTKKSFGN